MCTMKKTMGVTVQICHNQPDNKTIPLKTLEKRRHLMSGPLKRPAEFAATDFFTSLLTKLPFMS